MKAMKHYDIFISYRRKDTGDKAEHLKDLLDKKYKDRVSFDRENLTGLFDVALARRIDACKDFLFVVGKNTFNYTDEDFEPEQVKLYNYLATCTHEEFDKKIEELGANAPIDFVRIEIARALHRKNLNIIPIVPENSETFDFNNLNLPPDIAGIKRYEAVFYSEHPDRLFKDITHNLFPRLVSRPTFASWKLIIPLVVLLALGAGFFFWQQHVKTNELRAELEKKYADFNLYLQKDLSVAQMNTIDDILDKMAVVTPDSLWMSQFEFTTAQWHGIRGEKYDETQKNIPATGHSFGEVFLLITELCDMTNIGFDLPSSIEWTYAAHGGLHHDSTLYAGSDDVNAVAWYKENSDGKLHPSDGQQGKKPNVLDLYDMCGNASELCNTPMIMETGDILYTVCGGDYNSPAEEVTATSTKGVDTDAKDKTVGFRITIRKQ